ncbi:MAG: NADH-quinone oxidoreductase subunit N [Nitrososphaerota archaeon]|nr:NADH-quinone oxidoreductase subunit N [Nitrososphaerales archaeon]MDW8044360.1 NADH-quinone oxidoreductase subunit N [Nitrososphaerota archaeon]
MSAPIETLMNTLAVLLIASGIITPTLDYTFKRRLSAYIVLFTILIALFISLFLLYLTYNFSVLLYDGVVKVDFYGAFLALLAMIGTLLVLIASMHEVRRWSTGPSFYSLLPLTLLGVLYTIFLNDIILLFIAWTLVSVASYALVGIKKDEDSLEGAAKYALMGIMATTFMLFGLAFIYGLTGSTKISEMVQYLKPLSNEPLFLIGFILLIASFSFKIGVVPFHGWLPDVYGGVHPSLVSFVAGVVKIVGIAALLRVVYPLAQIVGEVWLVIFSILSIITMTFGNIAALVQRNVQRMMAYSSIAHAGYILLGFVAAIGTGYLYGLQGIALHISTYVFAKIGIFVALAYLSRMGLRLDLEGLGGLSKRMPITSISITMLLLSLIGVPPLLGFWSKFPYLFLSTIDIAPWLTFIAIVNSGISVGYYVQVIRYMFFVGSKVEIVESIKDPEFIVILITTLATIILGLGIAPLIASTLTL